jgi:hypothetical protein
MTASVARPLRDPVADALDRAAVGEPFPVEVQAELARIAEDLRTGREALIAHEDVPAWLEEQARLG